METIIREAARMIGSLGTYARLIVVGVWFPGFLVFAELGSTYFLVSGPRDQGLFAYVAQSLKGYGSGVVTTLIVVLVLATSITAGYVARDVAFAVSDLWLRRQWSPARRIVDIFSQIRRVYGAENVDPVASRYHVFKLATGETEVSSLPRLPDTYVREFCKQWLRLRVPDLNTEGLEIEINMVMGLVVPLALSSVWFLAFLRGPSRFAVAVAVIAAATILMYRINWARTIETEQVIVNFLVAHWHGLDSAVILPSAARKGNASLPE
jgi:hypothetical protein